MSYRRAIRVSLCGLAVLASLAASHTPASAAVASGSAAGGFGGSACDLSVSCKAFVQTCSISPANDIDASIRPAGVGGQFHALTFAAGMQFNPNLVVFSFGANCQQIGLPAFAANGVTLFFPPGTAYVGVTSAAAFAQLTWTLH
jgi:hypothetical protein